MTMVLHSACGIATVLVPLYLSSVAPPAIAGSIGAFNNSLALEGVL